MRRSRLAASSGSTSLDPKAQFHVGDEGGLPGKNYAIEAVEKAKAAYAKQWPDADMSALVWPVRLA